MTTRSWVARVGGALRFDPALYREVEADPAALGQAAAVVLLAGAGRGASALLEAGWRPLVFHALAAGVIWLVGSVLVWNVVHRLLGFGERMREIARVLGFAASPLLGLWLGVLPLGDAAAAGLHGLVHGVTLVSLVLALRASLRTSLARAIGVCLLVVLTAALVFFLIGVFLVGTPVAAGEGLSLVARLLDAASPSRGSGGAWT